MSSRITRRQFMLSAGVTGLGLIAGCGPLPFQQPPPTAVKVYRLGYLSGNNPTDGARNLDLFRQALGELGYMEGQNLIIEYRWGEGSDVPLAEAAAELARLPVDLFVVTSTASVRSIRAATTTVPVVLSGGGDLVAAGLAASYAHPGGNVTGVTTLTTQLFGKRLQILKEAVHSISRVAVFHDAATSVPFPIEAWRRDAQTLGLQVHALELHRPEEFDAVFEAAAREGADALLVPPGPLGSAHRARIIQLAAQLRWPAMYDQRLFVDEGGLMTYAASLTDRWRRAASHVDKILKGGSPAEIPIEQSTRFDFVVNLNTARELGITFPQEILLQVTEVIQ